MPPVTLAMETAMLLLGLESSCDDTAAALVRQMPGQRAQVLSSVVVGQTELHASFGGVVPEIAARAHAEKLDLCVEKALAEAELSLADVDGFAVTAGPGLIGGVLSGVMCAKGLSAATGKPLYGVNHLAGHALTPRLTDDVPYPYLMLLVSGGHCQFLLVHGPDRFERLGGTIDDAPGEAFDKVARLISLPQPGGPAIEQAAKAGDPKRFALPRPRVERSGSGRSGCRFPGCRHRCAGRKDPPRLAEISGPCACCAQSLCRGWGRCEQGNRPRIRDCCA